MRGRRAAAVAAATLAVVMSCAVAAADSGADEAEVRFRRAATLYKAGRLDEALGEFFASNRLAPNRNVMFNIARCFEALGRFEEAYRYYAEYRASEPDAAEQAALDGKLAELAPRVALVRITSDPPGATVYLDRKDLGGRGETPLVLAAPAGRHLVRVELTGHHPGSVEVELRLGAAAPADLALTPITGALAIRSNPSAQVFVDRAVGDARPAVSETTPAHVTLAPGRHTVELIADGHLPQRSDVVVRADRLTAIDVVLERRPPPAGTVVLRANRPGAQVTIDGETRGFTPAVLSLPVGRHLVEVAAAGHRPWRREVVVERDGRAFFEVELAEREAEVVGATRSSEAVSRAPASVTLLERAELDGFGYRTLAEALGAVRGLYVSDDLAYQAVGVRGFSRPGDYTNRLLVTRDGHALNDDWIGSAAVGRDLAPDLEDVERIEVVRGPGSTFYGASAFFGVINVVSRAPTAGPPVRAGGELDSRGGGSAFVSGRTQGRLGALSLHASAFDTRGEDLRFEEYEDGPTGGLARGVDGEDAQRVAVQAIRGDVAVRGSFARRRKALPTGQYETVFAPADLEPDPLSTHVIDRRGFVEGTFGRTVGAAAVSARLAYDYQSYDGVYAYDDDPAVADDAYLLTDHGGGHWATAEARVALTGLGQELTLGAEGVLHQITQGVDQDADGTDDYPDDRAYAYRSASLYAVDRIALGDRLELTAGLRFDRFGPNRDRALSPRAALVARPYHGGTSKLIVGSAFRAPSVFELYYNDGGVTQLAPTSLGPETIGSGELEHVHALGRRSYLLASLFGNRFTDLIIDPGDDDIIQYANSDQVVLALGGEVEARVESARGAWLSAALSATRIATDDRSARVNSAPVVGALRALWPAGPGLIVTSELIYNAPRPVRGTGRTEPVALVALHASQRLGTGDLRLRAGVTNLLDATWSVAVGEEFAQQAIAQRGRTFTLQLVYEP